MPSKSRKKTSGAEVLHIQGELTIFRAAELKPQILGKAPPAAIDLAGVTEIDTAGLQLLLLARRTALAEQRALPLLSPSVAVREVFALLNLDAHLDAATAPAGT